MSEIYTSDKFSLDAIQGLLSRKYAAIKISNFYSKQVCEEITNKLIDDPSKGNFVKAQSVQRIGMPHFDIVDGASFEKYHKEAINSIHYLREMYHPYLSPIDQFRLLLDELWPSGANIEVLYGKKCFVGLCRIIEAGSPLLPHIDRLSRDSADSYIAHSLIGQLAANIFIATPEEGGELEVWLNEPDLETYEAAIRKTNSYHVDKATLGEADVVIKPEPGDLILFRSHCYHGVRASKGGFRASIAAFVGYRGAHAPLTLWS